MFISSTQKKKKMQKSKQFNLYGKLTKEKFNFDSNWTFSKLWFLYILHSHGIYYINDL